MTIDRSSFRFISVLVSAFIIDICDELFATPL